MKNCILYIYQKCLLIIKKKNFNIDYNKKYCIGQLFLSHPVYYSATIVIVFKTIIILLTKNVFNK